ncbi:unnamed protein product [Bursaphelenchus xylophilus]|uniref:(pine wood nematode) hypothetical protein n=1 Tax=Bursaphelenchus xylophilus TaxID=6326 RepID=A0A1I7SA21_BURXY|nr:unnamed protein product [Bursaphelenchus xylophilus]CAG9126038.1 unnamed protein product [Bursaphelenchus xylophilus]
MSVLCVPHNFAVIRLDEGNEVKIVKRRQLRLKAFANGASCKLIVHDGVPRSAKIIRTFTTSNDARTYLDNINTAKQSWGFTTKAVPSFPSSEASTSTLHPQPSRTNICESKGLSDSILLTNSDSLVTVVKNRTVPISDRKRKSKSKCSQHVKMAYVQGLFGLGKLHDFEQEDQEEDTEYDPLNEVVRKMDRPPTSDNKPRREMTYDLSGLNEVDSGLSETSNANSSPDCASDNSNDELPVSKKLHNATVEPDEICSTSMSLLPKILHSIQKQSKVIGDIKRDHDGLKKTLSNVCEFMGELEHTNLLQINTGSGIGHDVATLEISKARLELMYMSTCTNPLGFFQLLCRLAFGREQENPWSLQEDAQKTAVQNILNHFFPTPSPNERLQRFVQKVFNE